jgi:hypothetical protein
VSGISAPILTGAGFALLSLSYYWLRKVQLAGSGRFTVLVDSVFRNRSEDAALREALRAATLARFGASALDAPKIITNSRRSRRVTLSEHLTFLAALSAGGALAQRTSAWQWQLDARLLGLVGSHQTLAAILVGAGFLVGFGARLAGGCTTGHSLVGVPQLQRGSLVATLGFFSAGVLTSLLVLK